MDKNLTDDNDETVEIYLQYYDLSGTPDVAENEGLLQVPLFSLVTLCALKQAGLTKETTSLTKNGNDTKRILTVKFIPIPEENLDNLKKPSEYFIQLENAEHIFHNLVILKKGESIEPQVTACVFPAVFVPRENLCITGLCSLLRYIIANFAPKSHKKLLGHQNNCLSAPAEVSTWTKFCEIDLPQAIEQEKQTDLTKNEIPYELAQFEIHLRQPVKIHNIRKRMQQAQQNISEQDNSIKGMKFHKQNIKFWFTSLMVLSFRIFR